MKELTNFNSEFRVFATCPANSASRLSEAVLSRFSVVSLPDYKPAEQKIVLQSCIGINRFIFDTSSIPKLIHLSTACLERMHKQFTFTQMIKTIELSSLLNKEAEGDKKDRNLSIIAYRLFGGLLDSKKIRKQYREIVEEIISDSEDPSNSLSNNFKGYSEAPLSFTDIEGYQGIKSNISELFIKCPNAQLPNTNLAFIALFTEMVDILHLGLLIHSPVIFEGPPGQGKMTAIKYIASATGYEVVTIMISQSTKVDDLLGKVTISRDSKKEIHVEMIETKLVKALKSEGESNTIIVFQNINNASPAVLNILVSIFDTQIKEILLPNGSTILKGKINLVGIFNSANGVSSHDKLPTSLISSSIYHVVTKLSKNDILHIILAIFSKTQFSLDGQAFNEKFLQSRAICTESNSNVIFTVNDIIKYVKLRSVTFDFFDESTISQIIFSYRFPQIETIQLSLSKLGLKDMKFNPRFSFNLNANELYIQISKESKTGMKLPIPKENINAIYLEGLINCLTLPQKHCLIFLASSVLAKRACLVQGGTASGKSHLVRLFAQMLGKKLFVYQMKADTGISILSGQSVLENKLSNDDINNFKKAINDLRTVESLNEYIKSTFDTVSTNKWSPQMFTRLIELTNDVLQNENLEEIIEKDVLEARNLIKKTVLPASRFHYVESSFIKAMENGHWVLIDGIESAPPEIAEKLSSLCDDDPELNLYECGQGYYFSRKMLPGSRRIHDDFHLFVTYNPISSHESQILDQSFLNKCLTFTLPPMDSTPEYSAQILLGSLVNLHYPTDVSLELGARLALMHSYAKLKSEVVQDSFAGDIQFTGRTLKFISKAFGIHSKNQRDITIGLHNPICLSMNSFYWDSYINEKKQKQFTSEMVSKFVQTPSDELMSKLNRNKTNPRERNLLVLLDLLNIQLYLIGEASECNFDFADFVNKCKLIMISDLEFVYSHIVDTIRVLHEQCPYENVSCLSKLMKFSCLISLEKVFKDIIDHSNNLKSEHLSLTISDPDLLSEKTIRAHISRFAFLTEILKDNIYFAKDIPAGVSNSILYDLLKITLLLAQDLNMKLFELLISSINQNPQFLKELNSIFPYNLFYNTKFERICSLVPLFKDLNESKTDFEIKINEKSYFFHYPNSTSEFNVLFSFNNNKKPILTQRSAIFFPQKKSRIIIPDRELKKADLIKWNNGLINVINYCLNNATYTQQILKTQLSNNNSPKLSQYGSFSLLFKNDGSMMIAKIWSLVFFLHGEKIDFFKDYLHPIEYDALIAISKYCDYLSPQSLNTILDFSKCLVNISRSNSILWQCLNNSFFPKEDMDPKEATKLISKIEEEIHVLKQFPVYDEHIWSTEYYIQVLESTLQPIRAILSDSINRDNTLRIKYQFKELNDKLSKAVIKKNEYNTMRIEMQKLITQISDKNPTEEALNDTRKKVEAFIIYVQKKEPGDLKNSIVWPEYMSKDSYRREPSTNQRLFELLIWYSNIRNIFDLIQDIDNTNVLNSIIDLGEYPEMKQLSQYLFSRIMNSQSGNKLIPTDYDWMDSTLNAQLIMKAKITHKIPLEVLHDIDTYLNKFSLRDNLDEQDVKWAHNIANQFLPNFHMVLPVFKPNDLICLFTNKINDSQYISGPAIQNIKADELHQMLYGNFGRNFETMEECAIQIGQAACRLYIDHKMKPPSQKKEIRDLLLKGQTKRKNQNKLHDSTIIEWIIYAFTVAENLGDPKEYNLEFDDIVFLKDDWKNEDDFVSQYPSFVYWLLKNQKCYFQIQTLFKDFEPKQDELPLWLHCLRLMSSNNCIVFDTISTSETSKIICSEARESALAMLNDRMKGSESIGIEWVNIFLSVVPSEILHPHYRLIYQFLHSLTLDSIKLSKEFLQRFKISSVKEFINNLFKLLFDDHIQDFLSIEVDDEDPIISFIRDPTKFVKENANNSINLEYDSFINRTETMQLSDYVSQMIKEFPAFISELGVAFEQESDEKRKAYFDAENKRKEKELKARIQEIKDKVENYNIIIEEFIQKPNKSKKGQDNIKKLIDIENDLMRLYPAVFTNDIAFDCIRLGIRSYNNYSNQNPTIINVHRRNDAQGKTIRIQIQPNSSTFTYYYFFKKYYDVKNIEEAIILPNPKNKITDVKEFKAIREDIDYKLLVNNSNSISTGQYQKRAPTLIFGRSTDKDQFIRMLNNLNSKLKSILQMINDFQNHNVSYSTFGVLNKIIDCIKLITDNSYVKFSDGSPSIEAKTMIEQLTPMINQLNKFVKSCKTILDDKIYQNWSANSPTQLSSEIFQFDYSLPLPEFKKGIYKQDFSGIRKVEFLSSPIMSISQNQITCCYKSLHCSIGPCTQREYQ